MGNSLHNKIRLGRAVSLESHAVRAALLLTALASIGALWLLIRSLD